MSAQQQPQRILLYLLRRDLRLADNPIFASLKSPPFTHLLPVYIFPADQIEVSGFVASPSASSSTTPAGTAARSPYPEARSRVAGFWRCGIHRAKFLAQSVWELKQHLRTVNSDLDLRVGDIGDALRIILSGYQSDTNGSVANHIARVWMTAEEGTEERRQEHDVRRLCEEFKVGFKLWADEKYLIDDRDLPIKDARALPDVFTTFRKTVEPLREAARPVLPAPNALPPLPPFIPPHPAPFVIPTTLDGLIDALHKPLLASVLLPGAPTWPPAPAKSAYDLAGGAVAAHARIAQLVKSGAVSAYKETRNGMLGQDYSTKLSAHLALGCITARQIDAYLRDFEDARTPLGANADGYGKGENSGTSTLRFELLWRDYMRLCARKFNARLFDVHGFRGERGQHSVAWKYLSHPFRWSAERDGLSRDTSGDTNGETTQAVLRFLSGRTGNGLVDASQRELFLTGYTSNRARQNVASFLAKRLGIDWRIGAEWYESCLVDHDISSNWGNWQYVAGVGNDPRGQSRAFNQVKQSFDYDPRAEYITAWLSELRPLVEGSLAGSDTILNVYQAWRLSAEDKARLGVAGEDWVEQPLAKIEWRGASTSGSRSFPQFRKGR
ncbi:hypothetical protein HDU87_000711 [Geranomyces variabilis]|uniref:Cryptochrome DASH n=1 Tax=Geranomyces variabilis TaxID=109894 RepID=A0AAD5TQ81_9FUNG|nr:hypothetical protein HDU87_000711 [Geranomyces variabilis]